LLKTVNYLKGKKVDFLSNEGRRGVEQDKKFERSGDGDTQYRKNQKKKLRER
jgi:hypothetical protein